MRPLHDSMRPMRESAWVPWQQLCTLLITEWWRVPEDYKRELCSIFAVPLGPANTPLCWMLCDSIYQYHARLHPCVMFELQRFHSRLLPEAWARFHLHGQITDVPDGAAKSVLFGFLFPIELWLKSKDLYEQPTREADNDLFTSYSLALSTAFPGIDYLALLLAVPSSSSSSAKTDKAAWRRRRK